MDYNFSLLWVINLLYLLLYILFLFLIFLLLLLFIWLYFESDSWFSIGSAMGFFPNYCGKTHTVKICYFNYISIFLKFYLVFYYAMLVTIQYIIRF